MDVFQYLPTCVAIINESRNEFVTLIYILLCGLTAVCVSVVQEYAFHVASAACEWVVAFSFVCFFLTYIDDFKVSVGPLNTMVYLFFSLEGFFSYFPLVYPHSFSPYR